MNKMLENLLIRMVPKPETSMFICGCGHTGTTLLNRILSTHPDIYSAPYETGAFISKRRLSSKAIRLLCSARLSGRPILLEKTPRHIHRIRQISQIIPNAKFLVVVRDGRDVVASLGKRYQNFDKALRRWKKDTEASVQALNFPNTKLFRYEDLIDSPPDALAEACSFLGVNYTDALLDFHKSNVDWGKKNNKEKPQRELRNAQVNQAIFDGRGRWQGVLPEDIVQNITSGEGGRLMAKLGYLS